MTTLTADSTRVNQPGPKSIPLMPGLPLLGNMFAFSHDVLGFVVRTVRDYPRVVEMRLLKQPFYMVNDPALIEEVLVTKNQSFVKDKGLKQFGKPVFGNGLLTSDGDFWRRQRRLAQPAFHRQRIAAYAESMTQFTEQMLQSWQAGEVRDLHADMMQLTLEVVAKTLFNKAATPEINEIGHALDVIMERFDNHSLLGLLEAILPFPLPTSLNRRYAQATQRLDEIVRGVITERRAAWDRTGEDRGDLLGMFLSAQDDEGQGMSDQQLIDECKTMFLAGHETTALALSWTFWLLDLNPTCKTKLQTELQQVLAGRTPTMADLPNLRYTERIIMESMRLMPPAWGIQREAAEEVEIGGYRFPKEAQILLSQYALHRDPRWYNEPERFEPDRWENDLIKRNPKFAYFPFGGGPRLCIGQQFAMMEAVLILAQIMQKFDLTLVPGQRIEPQPSITMRPRYGLKMRVESRCQITELGGF